MIFIHMLSVYKVAVIGSPKGIRIFCATDAHLLCDRCCEVLGTQVCTPQMTCDSCRDLSFDVWERIIAARLKRRQRNKRRPAESLAKPEEEEVNEIISALKNLVYFGLRDMELSMHVFPLPYHNL